MEFDFTASQVLESAIPWLAFALNTDVDKWSSDKVTLHEATRSSLLCNPIAVLCAVRDYAHFDIYTDGSLVANSNVGTGWAFVVVVTGLHLAKRMWAIAAQGGTFLPPPALVEEYEAGSW